MKPNKAGFFWGKFNNFPNKDVPYHLIIRIMGETPWLRIDTIVDFRAGTTYNYPRANSLMDKIEWGPEIERPESCVK